jgi:hypothetical protein
MSQGINDLIAAISSGNAEAIDTAFNAEMSTRIGSRLEDMRATVAKSMFATEQAPEEVGPGDEAEEAPVEEPAEEDAEPFETE